MHATRRTAASLALTALAAATLGLSACSSGSDTKAATATPAASTSAASSASGQSATESPTTAGAGTASDSANKADANNASKEEIVKALEAHGVQNADKMADEIEEYRPYTSGDIASKLGEELGKYNVDQATLTKILDSLKV